MNPKKHINSNIIAQSNLIGENDHRQFLTLLTTFALAQRGGIKLLYQSPSHGRRLISDVNIFTSAENKQLFSESVFSN